MSKQRIKICHILIAIPLLMSVTQSVAQFDLNKSSINSGGSIITGGSFEIKSSIGQASVSTEQVGGSFALTGGFWQAMDSIPREESIFKNDFEE